MNNWEEQPVVMALIIAVFIGLLGYLILVLGALLDQIIPIWVLAAIFGGTFVLVLTIEILTAAIPRPTEPPKDDERE